MIIVIYNENNNMVNITIVKYVIPNITTEVPDIAGGFLDSWRRAGSHPETQETSSDEQIR
jgi:hypothetical protein